MGGNVYAYSSSRYRENVVEEIGPDGGPVGPRAAWPRAACPEAILLEHRIECRRKRHAAVGVGGGREFLRGHSTYWEKVECPLKMSLQHRALHL